MRSGTYSVNENDYLISGFDASTCSGENIYEILRIRTKILLRTILFGSTLIKIFGKIGTLKPLTVSIQRIQLLKTGRDELKIRIQGFD